MIVRFSDAGEFLQELERDPHTVARKTVRITASYRLVHSGALTRVEAVGTAKVLSRSVAVDQSDYDLVEYVEHVGDLWGHADADAEVKHRVGEKLDALERVLKSAGFVVAAGRYEVEAARA